MKRLVGSDISGTWTFNPTARTVALSGFTYALNNLLLITNVTRNEIIYNFADATRGESAFSNNTVTLVFDTTSHSASDVLQIYVDVDDTALVKTSPIEDQLILLRRIAKLLEAQAAVDPQQRQRITLDAIRATSGASTNIADTIPVSQATAASLNATVSIAASQTLATVTNLATLAGNDQRMYIDWARTAYNTGIRSGLTFT